MNDEELDAAIAARFKAYEAKMRLAGDFKGRFVSSVRRKRAMRRLVLAGFAGATAAVCAAFALVAKKDAVCCGALRPCKRWRTGVLLDASGVSAGVFPPLQIRAAEGRGVTRPRQNRFAKERNKYIWRQESS